MSDLISIVIPVYNVDKYIEKCLNSVLQQTYQNLEIIVVDDGSTDNTGKIVDRLAKVDNRIVVTHKKNTGVSDTRNKGLEIVHGDYIGFVDGDDEIDIDMYQILYENIIKYNADISHCGYRVRLLDDTVKFFYGTKRLILQDNIQGQIDLLEGKIIEPGLCNKLVKKELFEGLTFPVDLVINEDLLMNFFLFKKARKSVFYDVCKYLYISRANSASRQFWNEKKIYHPIRIRELILANCEEGKVKLVADRLYINTLLNVYKGLVHNNMENLKKDKEQIKNKIIDNKKLLNALSLERRIIAFLLLNYTALFTIAYRLKTLFLTKRGQ